MAETTLKKKITADKPLKKQMSNESKLAGYKLASESTVRKYPNEGYQQRSNPWLRNLFPEAWFELEPDFTHDVEMLVNPLKNSEVRKMYKKYIPTVLNPMRYMAKERTNMSITEILGKGKLYEANASTPEEQQKLSESVVDFTKVSNYTERLKTLTEKTKKTFDETRKLAKKNVDALSKNVLENLHACKSELRETQKEEVLAYLAGLSGEHLAVLDGIIGKKDPKFSTLSDSEKRKAREKEATALFEPIHKQERELLEQYSSHSFHQFQRSEKYNIQWADVLSRQTPELLKAANEQRDIRYKEALEKWQKEEAEKIKLDPNISVGATTAYIDIEDFNAIFDPNGPPTLADFSAAISVDRKKPASERKLNPYDGFRYAEVGEKAGEGAILTIDENGGISFKSRVPRKDAYNDPGLKNTMALMANSIMQDILNENNINPDKAVTPSIKFHFSSDEYCMAAYRAALLAGFEDKDISFDSNKGKGKISDAQRLEIQKEVGVIHRYVGKRTAAAVHQGIDQLAISDPKKIKMALSKNEMSIEEANQNIERDEKNVKMLKEIETSGEKYLALLNLEKTRPLTTEEINSKETCRQEFNTSVSKLNESMKAEQGNLEYRGKPLVEAVNYLGNLGISVLAQGLIAVPGRVGALFGYGQMFDRAEMATANFFGKYRRESAEYFSGKETISNQAAVTTHATPEDVKGYITNAKSAIAECEKNITKTRSIVDNATPKMKAGR
jgi:hypothetical protein